MIQITRPYARGFILAVTLSLFCSFNLFAQKTVVGKIKSRSNNGPLNGVCRSLINRLLSICKKTLKPLPINGLGFKLFMNIC